MVASVVCKTRPALFDNLFSLRLAPIALSILIIFIFLFAPSTRESPVSLCAPGTRVSRDWLLSGRRRS